MYAAGFNQSHGEWDVNLNRDHHPRMKNVQDETTNQKMALSCSMQGDAPRLYPMLVRSIDLPFMYIFGAISLVLEDGKVLVKS